MAEIEGRAPDGSGSVNRQAVDVEGRAFTRAIEQGDFHHAIDRGTAYALYSTDDAGGGEESWFLQNDGEDIHVEAIIVSTAASGIFTVMHQTSGTAAGTELIGRNMILGRPKMTDITAFGNASVTGSVDGDSVVAHDIGTSSPFIFALDGLILPKTEALFVRTATAGIVHIVGLVYRT